MKLAALPEVITWSYTSTYGHAPRGFGSWAFSAVRNPKLDDVFMVHQARFAEAKSKARAHFRGQPQIWVCS